MMGGSSRVSKMPFWEHAAQRADERIRLGNGTTTTTMTMTSVHFCQVCPGAACVGTIDAQPDVALVAPRVYRGHFVASLARSGVDGRRYGCAGRGVCG